MARKKTRSAGATTAGNEDSRWFFAGQRTIGRKDEGPGRLLLAFMAIECIIDHLGGQDTGRVCWVI